MHVNDTVTDLIGYLLYELKSRNMPVSEFNMQKLVFQIKMDLGKDHELYPKLPFYWYLKGPYSDVVSQSFNSFTGQCNLIGDSILYEDNIFRNYNRNDSLISQFREIEDISCNIMSDDDFFYNHLDKEIYRQYAPYGFMYSYKYEIYDVAKGVVTVDFDVDNFIDIMYHCEGNLPVDSYFNEFNSLYANLSLNLDLIYAAGNFNRYWYFLQKPIISIWETFAKGVRVKIKDNFYDDNVKLWDIEFKNSLNDLSKLINETKTFIDFNDYGDEDYTSEDIKLLNATIGSYLRRQ